MSSKRFLYEKTGGFVRFIRLNDPLRLMLGGSNAEDENTRILRDAARQGAPLPHMVYTQVSGDTVINHAGADSCTRPVLHVYCYGSQPNDASQMADLLHDYVSGLGTGANVTLPDGTKVLVCNAAVLDSGYDDGRASGNNKKFFQRVILRFLISD